MEMKKIGTSNIEVSALCLGTMTFGTQTDERDAHAQIDRALEAGINFIDTAEMYPVNPISAQTCGRTEEIIGNWIAKTGRRSEYVIATKHSGEGLSYVREGAPISSKTISKTIEGNLRRLQTDYIDIYQFHWPNRGSYMFRKNWFYDPSHQNREETLDNMLDCLETLQKEVERGTIRHFGLSNESAWGTAQWLRIAAEHGLPRVQTIQNEYSLLDRKFDTDLSELCCNEEVALLAYSPLAAGLLTGKYRDGNVPKGSRASLGPTMGGRNQPRAHEAVALYSALAKKHGLDPVHMALAWCHTRPFMGSVIFGATSLDQLEHILAGADLRLGEELVREINVTHREHPMPY